MGNPLLFWGIFGFGLLLLVAMIGFIVVYVINSQKSSAIDERLEKFTEATMSLEEMELQRPFHERVIIPVMQAALAMLGKFSPEKTAEKARHNLQMAGNPGNITPAMFAGLRLSLAIGLFVLFGIVTLTSMENRMQALMYTALGAGIGYILPGIWLGQQIKKRKKSILKALPDALDLLTISVEAGLGFDVALQRVTEKWDDELSREFKRVISDMRLGRSRREGLRDMAERTDVEDVQTFVAAIIQADQLGVSMSKILRLQSDQMRVKRRQRAEEEAQKAPVKMLFPMVFLIFPALFVVILGPAVPRIVDAFGGL
jgi:tight adherence protein C